MKLKFSSQHDQMDCGPACLKMISSFYGKKYSLQYFRSISNLSREGVSLYSVSEAAKKVGFETIAANVSFEELQEVPLPSILYWEQNHFVVLEKIKESKFNNKKTIRIADPAQGFVSLTESEFKKKWIVDGTKGIVLLLNPTEEFHENQENSLDDVNLKDIYRFISPFKKEIIHLFISLLITSFFTLFVPFLTQSLIDKGVKNNSFSILTIILAAQIAIMVGSMVIEMVRNWTLSYIGTNINIGIIEEFLLKIIKLPISFFETKFIGDFNQRISDHNRIEGFLTSNSLFTIFSVVNLFIFLGILMFYDYKFLLAYFILTTLSVVWALYFLKHRKKLDYEDFRYKAQNQESILEIINGVQEIKLNNLQDYKVKNWKKIQVNQFKVKLDVLRLNQIQFNGFNLMNQFKNIFITFLAAREVIFGNITLGEMLAITYIIGQMNSPISQLISFFTSLQDAKLSLERLNEVQNQEIEEKENDLLISEKIRNNLFFNGIELKDVSFQYGDKQSPFVLKDINIKIPYGKTTAIVGASGSGKTTLMKLLLKFYDITEGEIYFDDYNLSSISADDLRKNCGVVMQEGFIFSDSIERNIITSDEEMNSEKFEEAVKMSNIHEFIDSLPLGVNTKIGTGGNGISGGQKQRILIARTIYKNPKFLFFDEATSALDAKNENIIHKNLERFFEGKTVVIIAHRLSTVKNADNIIVLDKGKVVESGSHIELVDRKDHYYNLIKNQLELGN